MFGLQTAAMTAMGALPNSRLLLNIVVSKINKKMIFNLKIYLTEGLL
jgi:hypothetical protein